jgi:uncharacterized protein with NRDE domain
VCGLSRAPLLECTINCLPAGQDLEAGGSWLGVSGRGRFAVLTNYRSPFDDRMIAAEARWRHRIAGLCLVAGAL